MKTVNEVRLLGNLGRDPEIRATQAGGVVANFSIATTEGFKDPKGEWQEHAEWHSLVAFGRMAEIVRDYVHKGDKLYIAGRLQTRSWESDGVTRYRTEIVVNDLTLLSSHQAKPATSRDDIGNVPTTAAEYEAQKAAPASNGHKRAAGRKSEPAGTTITDDDIPF